jgi:hypothetical protein
LAASKPLSTAPSNQQVHYQFQLLNSYGCK